MNALISGGNASKKNKKIEWSRDCQETFAQLKGTVYHMSSFRFTDNTKPFNVHIDASGLGLGAMLYQTQGNGLDKVIIFPSRTLNKSEHKYPVHKLEFLALKWAVTERFHEYMYGSTFDVHTDNNTVTL